MKPLPDVEAIAIGFLKDHADVVAIVGGRVYPAIPKDASFPLVTVTLAPSTVAVARHLLEGVVDVGAWSFDPKLDPTAKAVAHDVGATVQAALWDDAFRGIHAGLGVVSGVEDRIALQWLPDPETQRARYILQTAIYVHPLMD